MTAPRALRAMHQPEPSNERAERLAALRQKQLLTPSEAAVLLGRSKSWVCAALARGLLPGIRDGSRWIVRRADLLAGGWLADTTNEAVAAATATASGPEGR